MKRQSKARKTAIIAKKPIVSDRLSCVFRLMVVPRKGLEPSRLAALPPEGSASTNSATWAGAALLLAASPPDVNGISVLTAVPQRLPHQSSMLAGCREARMGLSR
jgi:hypothetical protein